MGVQKTHVVVGVVMIAVLLSLHAFQTAQAADIVYLPQDEWQVLQDLFENWNQSTKDLGTSLPGWKVYDYDNYFADPCYYSRWRGVFCYIALNEAESEKRLDDKKLFNASVVNLVVSDASVVGILPKRLWNLGSLVSITVTGNPYLTGSIPPEPTISTTSWCLKSLDLHGNGLNNSIPNLLFEYFQQLEDLNLSNNRLEGEMPLNLGLNNKLQTLYLSNNTLSGRIPSNIAANWSDLVIADFSGNRFTGLLPDLTAATSLQTLDCSRNKFDGFVDLNPGMNQRLAILDLSDNMFTGPMPNLGSWSYLESLNLRNNPFAAGEFPLWLTSLSKLQNLDLRNTSLTGALDLSMFTYSLRELKTLELDDNDISGTLNIDFLSGSNVPLQTIRLKNNRIDEVIFSSKNVSAISINLDLQGNPYCDRKTTDLRRCLCEQRCYNTEQSSNKGIIIGSAVGGSIGAVMMIIAALLYWKNRRDREYLLLTVHEKFAEYEMKPTLFAYSELQKATRDFHPDNKLGEGGFGAVYKGTLEDGSVVAVKQLLPKAQQSMDDFLNEVVLLASVKHRNLVKLKGCCLRGNRRLLVYEFVGIYDLAEALFEHRDNQVVTWPARFKICLGVARGLHYLHAGVDPRIIHRDIKANNILLDSTFHPKIADFGLAMLFPNEDTHVTIMQIAGTKGYLAPEYATRGQVSDKVDVFSFGVLALEVVSGRKNISFDVPPDQAYLIDWVWNLNEERRLLQLVDPSISLQSDEEIEVHRVINTALACIQIAAERRPTMAQVVGMLQGDMGIMEFVRSGLDENVNHRALLGLNSSATTFTPEQEESQVLFMGATSSSGSNDRPRPLIELNAIRAR